MPTPQLPEYMRISKYAKYLDAYRRRETWEEQVDRKFDMHLDKYGEQLLPVSRQLQHAKSMMMDKRVLGSQRVLQFGGRPVFQHNARVYNCTVSFCDRPRFFQECMYLLLCGCGTGFSVQRHHVDNMPPLVDRRTRAARPFVVPDTIEGWADAVGVLMSSFMDGDVPFPEYQGYGVKFDFSMVRPKGAPISSGSKAPGPEPLARALFMIEGVLESAMETEGILRPIDAYDITMHASDAVLAGGVRRSASIAIFSVDDHDMMTAKTGNWHRENPQRARSNNSALLLRGATSLEDFADIINHTREFGEPGFLWSDSTEMVINPCGEIGMWPVWEHEDGTLESGWQMCNLCEINGSKVHSKEDFLEACQAAATIGTLQAGYDHFPYLGETTDKIVKREALLGVSMTGMMENPSIMFDPDVQCDGARMVLKTNTDVALAIGINEAARATCIKPGGNSGCLLDLLCPGIAAAPSLRGIRHVQANSLEMPLQHFKLHNPQAVFESVWDETGNTEVIAFPYMANPGTLTRHEVGAIGLLNKVILTKANWVEHGTRPNRCIQPWLRHNISNTVYVGKDEWAEVTIFIYKYRHEFAGVTLLPDIGDKVFEQAPFMAAMTMDEIGTCYGEFVYVDAQLLIEELPEHTTLWEACDHVNSLNGTLRHDRATWVINFAGFCDEHFSGNVKDATLCLKDVYACDLYEHLNSTIKWVDWTTMREEDDEVNFESIAACAGGLCQI